MDKVLYRDGDKDRLLKGKILGEDAYLLTIQLDNNVKYRIGKASIISIRQGEYNNGEDQKEYISS